jgi:tetratricopeptide (TPR) repeat protein
VDVPALSPTKKSDYQIIPNGNNLELVTPYGRRILFGDAALKRARDYRFEIPLSELRPPAPPEATKPAPPVPPTVIIAPADRSPAATKKPEEEFEKAKPTVPPRVIVEYDYSDRLILEANRLYNRRKFYEASLTVEELLSKHPDLPRAWVMKGSLMYVQGQRDLAKTAWQKALELDPENREVQNFLGRLK